MTDEEIARIARVAHEANRSYCLSLGETFLPSWEDFSTDQKLGVVNGVKLHIINPSVTPQESHKSWMDEKLANGWKYGAVKDPELKEHPNLVAYDQLPADQRAKDFIFSGVVRAMLTEPK